MALIYSSLQPFTYVDANGTVSTPFGVNSGFQKANVQSSLVRSPGQVQLPAIVSHDGSWRHPVTGEPAKEVASNAAQTSQNAVPGLPAGLSQMSLSSDRSLSSDSLASVIAASNPISSAAAKLKDLENAAADAQKDAETQNDIAAQAEEEARRLAKAGFSDSIRRRSKESAAAKAALHDASVKAPTLARVEDIHLPESERVRKAVDEDAAQKRAEELSFNFSWK